MMPAMISAFFRLRHRLILHHKSNCLYSFDDYSKTKKLHLILQKNFHFRKQLLMSGLIQ